MSQKFSERFENVFTWIYKDKDKAYEKFTEAGYPFDITKKRDLAAMIFLDRKFPGPGDAIAASEHDVSYLGWTEGEVETLSDTDLEFLKFCGVCYSEEFSSLFIFT